MHPLSLVLGLVAGTCAGVLIGRFVLKSHGFDDDDVDLREELDSARKQVNRRERELNDAIDEAGAKVDALETALNKERSKAEKLEKSLKQTKSERDKALQQSSANETARLNAQKQSKGNTQQVDDLRDRIKALEEENTSLKGTASVKTEEVMRLRAEVATLSEGGNNGVSDQVLSQLQANEQSLDQILKLLLEDQHQRAVVLADSNGIVVSSAGERGLRDGVAAASQLLTQLTQQFHGMLPFGKIQAFSLRDEESTVVAGRTFQTSGETVAVATYGDRAPVGRVLDVAMDRLYDALK